MFFDAVYTQNSESLAGFGQVEFDLSDRFTFIAGLRYATEEKELDYLNVDESGFFTDVVGLPTNVAFDFDESTVGDLAKHDDDSVSGKVELDFKPNDDLLLYGSISRGTKSAGFNVGFLDQNADLRQQHRRDHPLRRGDADELRGGPQVDLGRRAHALQRRGVLLRLRGLPDLPLRAAEPDHLQH